MKKSGVAARPAIDQGKSWRAAPWHPQHRSGPVTATLRFSEYGLVSYLGVPLVVKDDVLGVLSIYTRLEHEFTKEETEFVTSLAGQAALAIHNARIYEEALKANRVKEEFLSVMSHELRTPLSVVTGYVGIIKERLLGDINAQQEEALQKVLARTEEQLAMIKTPRDDRAGGHRPAGTLR
jgi:GAF domain-containing protein